MRNRGDSLRLVPMEEDDATIEDMKPKPQWPVSLSHVTSLEHVSRPPPLPDLKAGYAKHDLKLSRPI